jgi:hypothetical protein
MMADTAEQQVDGPAFIDWPLLKWSWTAALVSLPPQQDLGSS